MKETLSSLDFNVSRSIAMLLSKDGIIRKIFHAITLTGTAVIWLIGLAMVYYLIPDFRDEAYSIFAVTLVMTMVVFGLKILIKRPRPEFKDDRFLSVSIDIFSFPSGHATRSAYVGILMPIYTPEFTVLWYLWAIIMILSRLLLGVHYVSDILAGLLLGTFAVSILFYLGWLPYFPYSEYLQ